MEKVLTVRISSICVSSIWLFQFWGRCPQNWHGAFYFELLKTEEISCLTISSNVSELRWNNKFPFPNSESSCLGTRTVWSLQGTQSKNVWDWGIGIIHFLYLSTSLVDKYNLTGVAWEPAFMWYRLALENPSLWERSERISRLSLPITFAPHLYCFCLSQMSSPTPNPAPLLHCYIVTFSISHRASPLRPTLRPPRALRWHDNPKTRVRWKERLWQQNRWITVWIYQRGTAYLEDQAECGRIVKCGTVFHKLWKSETLSHKFKIDRNDERFDNIKYGTTKRTESAPRSLQKPFVW